MKVLYLTPYVPYEGIPYAGGYFLNKYLRRISRHIDIQVVAPRTDENETAVIHAKGSFPVTLVGEKMVMKPKWQRAIPMAWESFRKPIDLPGKQLEGLAKALRDSDLLERVDLVEMHFSQTLPLIKAIKAKRPSLPVMIFEHDVYSQSVWRRVKGAPFSRNKLMNGLKLLRVNSVETDLINRCDGVFVFSDKDKRLLQKMGARTNIEVLVPAIEIPDRAALLDGDPICLFVGAMDRPENHEAASWFLENVWRKVLVHVPSANLHIVGANPPASLIDRRFPNVTITGFVKELGPYYEQACLCVVPLMTGAGVKFKVLQAMAFGLPVVTTPVGAEGIAENETQPIFPYITDDPERFTEGVIHFLKNESFRKQNGSRLRNWVEENYNFDKNTIHRALSTYNSFMVSV